MFVWMPCEGLLFCGWKYFSESGSRLECDKSIFASKCPLANISLWVRERFAAVSNKITGSYPLVTVEEFRERKFLFKRTLFGFCFVLMVDGRFFPKQLTNFRII